MNAKDDLGFTPAHLAAIHKKGTTFKALVEAGADVNIKNRTGQTPAEIANQKGIFFIR